MAIVFEDRWCRLTQSELVLKTFYFPTCQNKNIDLKSIRGIYFEEQNFRQQICKVKGWGMSFTPCWWGCDLMRNMHCGDDKYYNVAVDCGEKSYKGFTVQDITTFVDVIKPLIHPETEISGHLPF